MKELRERLVAQQVEARGVRDPLVLNAMRSVPRELFLPEKLRRDAYEDTPLPIGSGQTISQPYIVAFMIEALQLRGGEKVLEIGAGSGYAAAVLAEIAGDVFTIERIGQLAEQAVRNPRLFPLSPPRHSLRPRLSRPSRNGKSSCTG
jgi:protein-L-isoaspartate(D-aspartate) O-methyltransferase